MPGTPNPELTKMILLCRTERGMTLETMAKQVRLTPAGLSKIERGKVKPNRTTESRIIAFLNRHGYFPKLEAA